MSSATLQVAPGYKFPLRTHCQKRRPPVHTPTISAKLGITNSMLGSQIQLSTNRNYRVARSCPGVASIRSTHRHHLCGATRAAASDAADASVRSGKEVVIVGQGWAGERTCSTPVCASFLLCMHAYPRLSVKDFYISIRRPPQEYQSRHHKKWISY